MISFENKFLFVDIVKTGGTSICQVLEKYGGKGKHHSINRILPNLPLNYDLDSPLTPEVINDFFCFTFVRNPFDRLISLFSYCQSAPLQTRFSQKGWDVLATASHREMPEKGRNRKTYWPTTFSTFVEWLVEHEKYYNDFTGEKYIPMKDWITDNQGSCRVTFIGRYENLQRDFDIIMRRIAHNTEILPQQNKSMDSHKIEAVKELKSSRLLQSIIQSYFLDDFTYFQYSTLFEDSAANTPPKN